MNKLRDIERAVALLRAGELVAFPTETVYGLGADAANPTAVAKIFAAKGRPADHPVIVHLPGAGHLERWACDIPAAAWELAEAFWPGPLTLILKRAPGVPDAVTGGQHTVGLRVPAHPLALDLLRAYAEAGGGAHGLCGIAAPSANRFGRISPTTAAHVQAELGDAVRLVLDGGPCQVGIESTILDLSGDACNVHDAAASPRLLRPGHITPEQLEMVLGRLLMHAAVEKHAKQPRVSGSLDAHYAPQTPMRFIAAECLLDDIDTLRQRGRRCAVLCHSQAPQAAMPHAWRMLPTDPVGYAHGLYAALRELDQAAADLIVVENIPADPAWFAVADRLRRAVCGAGGEQL
jgi:L-threonylcarbamoyladenylate synthase